MTKQELLEYLGFVCDAENSIYSCNEIISVLEQKKTSIRKPIEPAKPIHRVNEATSEELNSGNQSRSSFSQLIGLISGIAIFFLFVFVYVGLHLTDFPIILYTLLAIVISIWLGKKISQTINSSLYNGHKGTIIEKNKNAADARYHQEYRDYEQSCQAFLRAQTIYEQSINALNVRIDEQQENISRLHQLLEKLYSKNIIYPSFREIIAVNQIREYLDMGICDTLEGSTGAYSQYMQDVRISRVCTSIIEMKKQLTEAIHSSQNLLLSEMRSTNERLEKMNSSLSTSLSSLNSSIDHYKQSFISGASAINSSLDKTNKLLSDINSATQATVHNQYIAAREANIQGYLLRLP
ncbi:MAG: hypothetical protein E7331_00090 [Clostridiales bacterium]|nr:hypothetical protein [Clostridiales bacterium]